MSFPILRLTVPGDDEPVYVARRALAGLGAIAADTRQRAGCGAHPEHDGDEEAKPSKPPAKERTKKAKKKKRKAKPVDHAAIARRTAARLARLEGLAASERRERARDAANGALAGDKLLLAFTGKEPARALAKARRAAGVASYVHQEIDPGLAAWANGIVRK